MTTPREDAIAARIMAAHDRLWPPPSDAADPSEEWVAEAWAARGDFDGEVRAALAAEAETPDRMSPTVGGKYPEPLPATPHPQRRWHRCEYPGCGLWHDSRDEVTP